MLSPADAIDTHTSPGLTPRPCQQDVGVLPHLGVANDADVARRRTVATHAPSPLGRQAHSHRARRGLLLPAASLRPADADDAPVTPVHLDPVAVAEPFRHAAQRNDRRNAQLARNDGGVREQAAALDDHAEGGRKHQDPAGIGMLRDEDRAAAEIGGTRISDDSHRHREPLPGCTRGRAAHHPFRLCADVVDGSRARGTAGRVSRTDSPAPARPRTRGTPDGEAPRVTAGRCTSSARRRRPGLHPLRGTARRAHRRAQSMACSRRPSSRKICRTRAKRRVRSRRRFSRSRTRRRACRRTQPKIMRRTGWRASARETRSAASARSLSPDEMVVAEGSAEAAASWRPSAPIARNSGSGSSWSDTLSSFSSLTVRSPNFARYSRYPSRSSPWCSRSARTSPRRAGVQSLEQRRVAHRKPRQPLQQDGRLGADHAPVAADQIVLQRAAAIAAPADHQATQPPVEDHRKEIIDERCIPLEEQPSAKVAIVRRRARRAGSPRAQVTAARARHRDAGRTQPPANRA